jgi:two-component system sensor histidine kinase DegS
LGLFRIAQEAVSNAIRHAKPTRISIGVIFKKDAVTLTVRDDGSGISLPENGDANAGFGVEAMRERARQMEGSIELESCAEGGTRIVVTVPASDEKQSPG